MNQASNQHASVASWRRWSAIVVLLLSVSQVATAKRSLERGVNGNQNQLTRELQYYDYDQSLAYKNSLKERKSSSKSSKGGKGKGGKGSKKKKCKGKKSKGKSKKSKKSKGCDEYWSSSETGGYESTNERPWSPVSQAYPDQPSPPSPHYPAPSPRSPTSSPTVEWSPSAPYWYYSPSSPAAWDYPTEGSQEEPTPAAWDYPTEGSQEEPTPAAGAQEEPTYKPTASPTDSPTAKPTNSPTDSPTPAPVEQSEAKPVQITIVVPTVAPSEAPQVKPVEATVVVPTVAPSGKYVVKPVDWPTIVPSKAPQATPVPTIAPSSGPDPTLAPYEVIGSEESPFWSPVWFPSEFLPTTANWKTESILSGGERGAMSTCETLPPDTTIVEVLEFTYEMFLTFGTNNPDEIASTIETYLHHELATRLLVCNFGTSSGNADDFEFTTVISLPKDSVTNNACSGIVTMNGTECYEVLGEITVSFIERSQQSFDDLIDGMDTVMEEIMHGAPTRGRELQESPLLWADPAIEGLFFSGFITGDERADSSKEAESSQARASASSSKTIVGAVSLAAAAVIVVLGGLIVFRRRRSNGAYLDMSSEFNSRIGIKARGDSPSTIDTKPIGPMITDYGSDFDLSVYTNTGNSASEDLTSLPDVSGVDMAPIGITPKEGPSETSTAQFPIVSPELTKTQEIARLPDDDISVAPLDLATTQEVAKLPDESSISIAPLVELAKTQRLPDESTISVAPSCISMAYSEDAHPFSDTIDV